MTDFSHLNAIEQRLHNEKIRLANAKTKHETEFRKFSISQVEKELRGERKFLGLEEVDLVVLSDDELFDKLFLEGK